MVDASTFLSGVLGGNANSSYEPQRTNGALLYVSGIGNGASDSIFTLSLKSFPLPKVTVAPSMAGYLNEKRKFAGEVAYDDLSIQLYDFVDLKTMDTMLNWFHQVYDPRTGQKGLKSTYAKHGFVKLFAPDGSFERQYDLVGLWPSSVDPGEIDQNADDLISISMNFCIDKAIPVDGFTLSDPITSSG